MKPVDFDYVAAAGVSEAAQILASQEDAKVLAGGQSLVPLLNFRLATPTLLVDINRIPDLDQIREVDGGIALGATVRQADALASPILARRCPLLPAALALVGHPQIRARGTVVGSLVHHDPASELPAVALALGARITLQSTSGTRVVEAADLFITHYTTDVAPNELATEVWFPASPPGSGAAFEEVSRRHGDFALVGVAALVTIEGSEIMRAAVAFSGVAGHPIRAPQVEAALVGRPATSEAMRGAARAASDESGLAPPSDLHASASYRLELLPVLVERALSRSAAIAVSGG